MSGRLVHTGSTNVYSTSCLITVTAWKLASIGVRCCERRTHTISIYPSWVFLTSLLWGERGVFSLNLGKLSCSLRIYTLSIFPTWIMVVGLGLLPTWLLNDSYRRLKRGAPKPKRVAWEYFPQKTCIATWQWVSCITITSLIKLNTYDFRREAVFGTARIQG